MNVTVLACYIHHMLEYPHFSPKRDPEVVTQSLVQDYIGDSFAQ